MAKTTTKPTTQDVQITKEQEAAIRYLFGAATPLIVGAIQDIHAVRAALSVLQSQESNG